MWVNAPVSQCGNQIVESGEVCDGGACCAADCTFKSSTSVCRDSAGECDIADMCTGSSIDCPADSFKPSTTSCGIEFGVCDTKITRTCSGTGSQCGGYPISQLNMATIQWLGYNVISFNNLYADTGSIGGRLAVRNDVSLGTGFSVGSEVRLSAPSSNDELTTAHPITFSFIGGRDVSWTSGQLFPDNTFARPEYGFAGNSLQSPDYLSSRFIGNNANNGAVGSIFDDAKTYYTAVSDNLASLSANVAVRSQYSGLFLSCSEDSDMYVANVDSASLNSATWFAVEGCTYGSSWIINVASGSDAVIFQGGDFAGIAEKVIFNIRGSREIIARNGVRGSILAPSATLNQEGGVTNGVIIVGDIYLISSTKNPNCQDYRPFDIVTVAITDVPAGSLSIPVASVSALSSGTINFGTSGSASITSAIVGTDGVINLQLASPLEQSVGAGDFFTQHVENPKANRTELSVTNESSDSSTISFCFAIIVALIALLL